MAFRILMIIGVLLVSGCRNKYWTETMPDRHPGYGILCQGSMATCYQRAAKLCPQGYTMYFEPGDEPVPSGKIYVPSDETYAGPSTPLTLLYTHLSVSCGQR